MTKYLEKPKLNVEERVQKLVYNKPPDPKREKVKNLKKWSDVDE